MKYRVTAAVMFSRNNSLNLKAELQSALCVTVQLPVKLVGITR